MDSLAAATSRWMGRHLRVDAPLRGGGEAEVWSASTATERFVVHVSARWREPAELAWCHAVAARAAASVPEVVVPISVGGHTSFRWDGRLVAVFPFVEGEPVDREDPDQVAEAGRLLARIHRALLAWQPVRPPAPAGPSVVDDDLADGELDAWWSRCLPRVRHGVCHGDFYRRNVLVSDGRFHVIDWSDAHVGPLIREVGFAAWEFGKDDALRLVRDRFDLFVAAYREEARHLPAWEFDLVDGAARIGLRDNLRHNVRHAARRGDPTEDAYHQRQRAAFESLRCALPAVPTPSC